MDYLALFARSPNPYVVLDRAFTIVDMNEAYLKATMRRREDILGRSMFDAFPSDEGSSSNALLKASLDRAFATGTVDHLPLIPYPIARPDGTLEDRFWSATHTPLTDEDGQVSLVLQHTVDVSELHVLRQLAESRLAARPDPATDHPAATLPMMARDVVRRAEAVQATNDALLDELRRLTSLFEQAPGFVAVLRGPDHVFEVVNRAYVATVGRADLIGRSVRDALPDVAGQGFYELLDTVYATGRPHVGQGVPITLVPPGGEAEEHVLDFVYQPFLDERGAVAGIFVQGHDVTERRRAEEAVREEMRALDALVETAAAIAAETELERIVQAVTDAGVAITGARFGAFFYNSALTANGSYELYALSGVPRTAFARFPMPRPTELLGPTFDGTGLVRSDDITTDPRFGRNAPHAGMPRGHLPVRSYLAVPVKGSDGAAIGGLFFGHPSPGVFGERCERLIRPLATHAAIAFEKARLFEAAERDLAERRRAEAALQALNADLERQVRERTEELRRNELALHQAHRLEAIGKLTGGVAHDFNNLLQVIAGNLALLARDVAGHSLAEQRVRNALDGVFRGARLAAQLLAFGRRQPLEPKVIDVGRFVRGLDDMLRRALGEAIEIEVAIAADLWTTLADPTQIENALLNLAINARDAMDGHGRLGIEVRNAALDDAYVRANGDVAPGDYVMIAVSDTGSGIPPEIVDKVFEPFFTTKPEGRGTGLGLSMVYGFVKQSGGHVKIDSTVGAGTTISVYLPRSDAAEETVVKAEPVPAEGGNEVVLVVEDDDAVRATVVELLADLGYRVLRARDAPSALAIVESGVAIDLLFTDVVMPGPLRSPDLAAAARARLPELAILFTSGYTENAIVHAGRLDPGVDLLSKPYARDDLARKVRAVLDRRVAAEEDRATAATPRPADPPAPVAATASTTGASADARPDGGTEARPTVLVVEDDDFIRANTADLVEDLGYRVLEADGVATATARLRAGGIDLLLTDVGLPDGAGTDLAARARHIDPAVRIVFATGRDAVDGVDPAVRAAPGFRLLQKPYDRTALAAALLPAADGADRPD